MLVASASVLSSWVSVLADALESEGGDRAALLELAGFGGDALRDPNARHSVYDVARLWHLAATQMGDPAFSLRVPLYVRHTTFHALSSAVFASATVGDALGRVMRYRRVITDSGTLRLEHEADRASLCIIPSLEPSQRAEAFRDSILSLNFCMLRALVGARFVPRGLTLQRAPGTDLTTYVQFFGCQVERGDRDALHFDASLLDLELPTGNPELVRHNELAVRAYLARLDSGSLVDRARDAIDDCASDELSPERIARKLGMSLRSLQRGLHERGSSYEKLVRGARLELACSYLREGRHSVTETAFALGYESASAFSRAFKRWTGLLPTEYQHSLATAGRTLVISQSRDLAG
jgi:AraC-like DNA-binding protein